MIQIVAMLRGKWVEVGLVETLAEARDVVKLLDILYKHKALPREFKSYTTNTQLEARQDGKVWEYSDQDPSGASDGVWFG